MLQTAATPATWLSWKTLILIGKIALGIKIVAVGAGYLGWAIVAPTAGPRRHKFLDHVEEVITVLMSLGKMDSGEFQVRCAEVARLRESADKGWHSLEEQWTLVGLVRFVSIAHAKSTHEGLKTTADKAYKYASDAIFGGDEKQG